MRIAVDTNVLVRAVVQDDPKQAEIASKTVKSEMLASPIHVCVNSCGCWGGFMGSDLR